MYFKQWGQPGDIPVVGGFDGDGASDLTVFRIKSDLTPIWWIRYTSKSYYYSNFSAQTEDTVVTGAASH